MTFSGPGYVATPVILRTSTPTTSPSVPEWLAAKQAKGKFPGYDPDTDFEAIVQRLAAVTEFPLAEG
jgi:hypothetical protein